MLSKIFSLVIVACCCLLTGCNGVDDQSACSASHKWIHINGMDRVSDKFIDDEYHINVEMKFEVGENIDFSSLTGNKYLNFSLFNQAQACKASTYRSDQNILDLSVTSNIDINDQYPANESLNELIQIGAWNGFSDFDGSLSEYLNQSRNAPLSFSLRFTELPPSNEKHTFTVSYQLENGEIFYTTVNPSSTNN